MGLVYVDQHVHLVNYSEDKSKMALAICDVNVKALLSIAQRLLKYSQQIDSYSFQIKTVHSTFQNMLKRGNPYKPFEETLCIKFIDIEPYQNHIKIYIEIIINPNYTVLSWS